MSVAVSGCQHTIQSHSSNVFLFWLSINPKPAFCCTKRLYGVPPMCMFLCSSCCSILLQWRGCWAQKQRLRCWSNRSSNTNELSDVYICTMVIETVMQTLSRCVLLMVNKSPCPENYFKNLISEQIFLQITKYKHFFFLVVWHFNEHTFCVMLCCFMFGSVVTALCCLHKVTELRRVENSWNYLSGFPVATGWHPLGILTEHNKPLKVSTLIQST